MLPPQPRSRCSEPVRSSNCQSCPSVGCSCIHPCIGEDSCPVTLVCFRMLPSMAGPRPTCVRYPRVVLVGRGWGRLETRVLESCQWPRRSSACCSCFVGQRAVGQQQPRTESKMSLLAELPMRHLLCRGPSARPVRGNTRSKLSRRPVDFGVKQAILCMAHAL